MEDITFFKKVALVKAGKKKRNSSKNIGRGSDDTKMSR